MSLHQHILKTTCSEEDASQSLIREMSFISVIHVKKSAKSVIKESRL